ncbi:MAG TPA: hypothetical protein VIT91_17460 [Chthoniobacterales bacterium]
MSDHHHDDKHIQLPAPTPWPLVMALGLSLAFGGLVLHWAVTVLGFIMTLCGVVGWFRDIYPHEKHEASERLFAPEEHEPEPAPRTVEHLHLGEAGHRIHYPERVHPYTAGIRGGIVGGLVMAIIALAYGYFVKGSIWWPVNLMSASVLPWMTDTTPETLAQFSMSGLIAGVIIHACVSVMVGLLYAAVLPMFPKFAVVWAGILSPLFWTALFYSTAQFINPVMHRQVDWLWFTISQLGFGLIGGFVVARSQKIETLQSYPMAVRAGVEAMEKGKKGGTEH